MDSLNPKLQCKNAFLHKYQLIINIHSLSGFNALTLKESCWFGNAIAIHSTCRLQRVQDHMSFVVLKYTVILFRVRPTDH